MVSAYSQVPDADLSLCKIREDKIRSWLICKIKICKTPELLALHIYHFVNRKKNFYIRFFYLRYVKMLLRFVVTCYLVCHANFPIKLLQIIFALWMTIGWVAPYMAWYEIPLREFLNVKDIFIVMNITFEKTLKVTHRSGSAENVGRFIGCSV